MAKPAEFFSMLSREITVDGRVVKPISPNEAEACDVLICMRTTDPLLHPSNLTGTCTHCGEGVQFVPNAPKRPPRMCFQCFKLMMAKEEGSA